MPHMIFYTGKRRIKLCLGRISKLQSIYSPGHIVTVDLFGKRIGENGCATFHGKSKDLGKCFRALADKFDPPGDSC